jgi:protein-S-isoprenylcysteine O-methyltransferase Ste14
MTSGLTAGGLPTELFIAAYASWIATEFVGAGVVPRWRARGARPVSASDQGSRAAILAGVFGSVLLVAALADLGLATLPLPFVYLGSVLMFVGIGVRQWAIAVLGRFFSTSVRRLEDHEVVDVGPYRVVRHPSYSGAILTLVGIGLAGGSWEGLVAIAGTAAVVFGYRIHVEERFLLEQLGPKYAAYRARTKRLIPLVL